MANNIVEYFLRLKNDGFSSGIKKATAETEKLNGAVNKTQSSLSALGGVLSTAAFTLGIKKIIDIGSGFEQAEAGLKTFLGSAEAAAQEMNMLREEATKSPFDFKTILMGNKALISAGENAENAKVNFNALANAIAATGGGNDELQRMVFNLQQIKNTGEATSVDIKQFAIAGINIYKVLEDYSLKRHIQLDKEKISYEQITEALKFAASEAGIYYNGLSNLANTTSGRISNLGDAFDNLAYVIFNILKPAIDGIVTGITSFMNTLQKHQQLFAFIIGAVGTFATALIITTAAQWALNTAMAFAAGLTGVGWIAVAAAGAAALAVGLYAANNAQEALNNTMSGAKNTISPMSGMAKQTGQANSKTSSTKKSGTSIDAVEARRSTNFNIDIGSLVENFTISTTNIKESATAIKAKVTQSLIEAVNDFQIHATK